MFKDLDPLLHSQLRLAIVSLLVQFIEAEFTYLRDTIGASAGNLSVQLDKLEKAGYIAIEKTYKGKKPLTRCSITKKGKAAFKTYIEALNSYLDPSSSK